MDNLEKNGLIPSQEFIVTFLEDSFLSLSTEQFSFLSSFMMDAWVLQDFHQPLNWTETLVSKGSSTSSVQYNEKTLKPLTHLGDGEDDTEIEAEKKRLREEKQKKKQQDASSSTSISLTPSSSSSSSSSSTPKDALVNPNPAPKVDPKQTTSAIKTKGKGHTQKNNSLSQGTYMCAQPYSSSYRYKHTNSRYYL